MTDPFLEEYYKNKCISNLPKDRLKHFQDQLDNWNNLVPENIPAKMRKEFMGKAKILVIQARDYYKKMIESEG